MSPLLWFLAGWLWSYLLCGLAIGLVLWLGRRSQQPTLTRYGAPHVTIWVPTVLPGISGRPPNPKVEQRKPEDLVRILAWRN